MAFSKFSTFVGIGKETTLGTAVAPDLYLPVTDAKPEDLPSYVADTGMRGSAVEAYNEIRTQGNGTYEIDGPVYMDTIGIPLLAVLGSEDVTGTSAPYTHAFAGNNTSTMQPPTWTISDYNGNNTRQFPGAMCSQLEFTYSADALLSYKAMWSTFPSTTTTSPTETFSTNKATAGYVGVLKFGGTQATNVESGTLTISRAVNVVKGITGTTDPATIFGGAVSVTGQFTAIYDANAETDYLAAMLAGDSTTFDLKFTNGSDSLEFVCTDALFTKAPISRGKDYIEITVDFTAVANTTDANTAGGGYSPIKATLTNSQPAY